MTETNAKIRAKGLDGTGFTEDLAASLFNRVGHNLKAIIELQVVDKHGPNLDGKRGIELVITGIEVADDTTLEDHLRELSQTLYYNRGLEGHTGTTTGGQERTVADVVASGAKLRPHPFLPVDAADENSICDVCGVVSAAGPHTADVVLEAPGDDEQDPLDEGDATDDVDEHEDAAQDVAGGDGPDVDALTDEPAEEQVAGVDEPWEYAEGEGDNTKPLSVVPDPFAAPAST